MIPRSLATRQTWGLVHRYVGLVLALFLIISGLTGSLLAFYDELDVAINAEIMTVTPPSPDAQPLAPLVLRELIQAHYPNTWIHWVDLAPKPDHAWTVYLEGAADPETKIHADIEHDTLFVNPYTGKVLGKRMWGDIRQGLTNLMPFIYLLHYSLALGTIGEYIFGIVALLWTLDCFVGAYLTFPAPTRRQNTSSIYSQSPGIKESPKKNWIVRWWQSWTVRWKDGNYKVNFDLHRAGGLWPWAMLFVLAWSGVGFNLFEVYKPVMGVFFTGQTTIEHIPNLLKHQPEPHIPWDQALEIGQELMTAEARRQGFTVHEERSISFNHEKALYRYNVQSDRDIGDRGSTSIWFNANTGIQHAIYVPTGKTNGDTISTWLFALHMAAVGGMPFQIFLTVVGLAVVSLSVTGVIIWRKKETSRQVRKQRQTEAALTVHSSKPSHSPIEWKPEPAQKQPIL